jgi:hypothetical protein
VATEDDPAAVDWDGVPQETTVDVPVSDTQPALPVTAPIDVRQIPGYEFGYAAAKAEWLERGINRALTAFRLAQIESGTEPGVAFVLAEQLRRWMEENKDRLDDRTPA